mmetsp:Transcript_123612/g.357533  ORF Transcript_123612/g.357533 Transcript_123612/m.357533 type:complete len:857 (-) Transcript_123612:81-2651(-)
MATVEELEAQVARFIEERERWLEEQARLTEELETLRSRCQKLARAASRPEPQRCDVSVQTEGDAAVGSTASACMAQPRGGTFGEDSEAGGGRLPAVLEQMLRSPEDEEVQFKGIEALFSQQTQVDNTSGAAANAPTLQASLEAAVAVFSNHPLNRALLLKACQLLSVLLAEPSAQHQLPLAVLWNAAQAVVSVSVQLLADASIGVADGVSTTRVGKAPAPTKLLTWFLSLLALLFPCLGAQLSLQAQSEQFMQDLLQNIVSKMLVFTEWAQEEALTLKCVQLLPLLPMEPWVQKACLNLGAVHALSLTYLRWKRGAGGVAKPDMEAALPKAIQVAVRGVFTDNLELCVKAVDDIFVSDEFVCLEVLDQLRGMERRRRGTFRDLDKDHGIIGKALLLWNFHQRAALEAPDPATSLAREVLHKVAELLRAVILKLPSHVLLQRMKEFETAEVFQRLCLAAIHANAQLRLQIAVNYVDNGAASAIIGFLQALLQNFEGDAPPAVAAVEAAIQLLADEQLPAGGWPYVQYCLDVCLHILSHWSALSMQKADVLDAKAAPLLLAQGGLVDVLAEILDPKAAGVDLREKPPQQVANQATETLQALFEQNGHICLFCMQHYTEVKQIVSLACDSLSMDPLTDYPEMQQQAVTQLIDAFERFSVHDERLGRRILKALTVLFESSYRLVFWFLQNHPLGALGEYQSTDVHSEAVRAVARAPYWSAEDAPLLPQFVGLLAAMLLDSIKGLGEDGTAKPSPGSKRRTLDLTEAEEVVSACMTSVLHLLLIDPSPPTVLRVLAQHLALHGEAVAATPSVATQSNEDGGDADGSDERAVNAVMRVMQVFPSSDRVQMNCQHLLTSLLGE